MDPFRPGTRVQKSRFREHDAHPKGARATVYSAVGPIPFGGDPRFYCYLVEWDDLPGLRVLVTGDVLERVEVS